MCTEEKGGRKVRSVWMALDGREEASLPNSDDYDLTGVPTGQTRVPRSVGRTGRSTNRSGLGLVLSRFTGGLWVSYPTQPRKDQ